MQSRIDRRAAVAVSALALGVSCVYESKAICADCAPCAKATDCPSDTQDCVAQLCLEVVDPACRSDEGCEAPGACQVLAGADCVAGTCRYLEAAPGTSCDDDEPCTVNDQCSPDGECLGENATDNSECRVTVNSTLRVGECHNGRCGDCVTEADCPNSPSVCYDRFCSSGWCNATVAPDQQCMPAFCANDTWYLARTCGPEGNCPQSGSMACANGFVCSGSQACATQCSPTWGCAAGHYCDNTVSGVCAPCESGPETTCDDGMDNNCDGWTDCMDWTCDGVAGCTCTVDPPGAIAEVSCGDGLDNDCDGAPDCLDLDCTGASCGGNSTCVLSACGAPRGSPCEQSSECIGSDVCEDGVCCDASCDGECNGCNVPGSVGTCGPRPALDDSECPTCAACDALGACTPQNGTGWQGCSNAGQACCAGECMDGVGTSCGSPPCQGSWQCINAQALCSSYGTGCGSCAGDRKYLGSCTSSPDWPMCEVDEYECEACELCEPSGGGPQCSGVVPLGGQDTTGGNRCDGTDYCDGFSDCLSGGSMCTTTAGICSSGCCLNDACCAAIWTCETISPPGACDSCDKSFCASCCAEACIQLCPYP